MVAMKAVGEDEVYWRVGRTQSMRNATCETCFSLLSLRKIYYFHLRKLFSILSLAFCSF